MKTYKDLKKLFTEEKLVKKFKVLKNSEAKITKDGNMFVAYIDSEVLDEFKSQKDAEKGIADFIKLIGK
jgi:hypothetical protein|tara:strand:- start:984 stop:1190 length:207 start_codon:yes stop_codon:yes gene_type:complete